MPKSPLLLWGGVISGNQKTSRLIEFKQKHAIPSHKAEAKSRPIVNAPAYAEGEYMTINALFCYFDYWVEEDFCGIHYEMELPYDGGLWIDIYSETPEINATFTKEDLVEFGFYLDEYGVGCGNEEIQNLRVEIAEDGNKIDIYLDTEDGGKYHIVYPFTITDYKTINFTEEQTYVRLMNGYIQITGENENGEYAEFRINTFSTAGSFSKDQIEAFLYTPVDEEVQCFDVKATLDENGVKVVYDGVNGVEYTINFSCTIPARPVAKLPFAFNDGKNQLTTGMYQFGLGNDNSSAPKLNFDSNGDYLIINYEGEAATLTYQVRYNGFRGTFVAEESADGQIYTTVKSHFYSSSTYITENSQYSLKPNSRFVRFRMQSRGSGNLYLGNIQIKKEPYKRDVKVGSWGTVCMPFDADVSNVVEAGAIFYAMTDVDENGVISIGQENYLSAGYPYIYLAISDKLTLNEANSYVAEEPEATDFMTGVFEDTQAPVGSYVLQNQKGVYGFYQVAAGEQPTIKANRAYITGQFDARTLLLDDDVTAIKDVKVDGKQTVIYNMAGQRVNKAGKGIFIINGKKVLK